MKEKKPNSSFFLKFCRSFDWLVTGLRIYQILINKFRDQQIELSPCGRPILLITRMITDRTGLHLVLLPLLE